MKKREQIWKWCFKPSHASSSSCLWASAVVCECLEGCLKAVVRITEVLEPRTEREMLISWAHLSQAILLQYFSCNARMIRLRIPPCSTVGILLTVSSPSSGSGSGCLGPLKTWVQSFLLSLPLDCGSKSLLFRSARAAGVLIMMLVLNYVSRLVE